MQLPMRENWFSIDINYFPLFAVRSRKLKAPSQPLRRSLRCSARISSASPREIPQVLATSAVAGGVPDFYTDGLRLERFANVLIEGFAGRQAPSSSTSAALAKLHDARIPYISVLTDPTTGGVSASIAMLGDVIIAEPKAMIGFAGPRVIKETIRAELPEGFQRAEYLLEHGMVDLIVERKDLRHVLASLLEMLKTEEIMQLTKRQWEDRPSLTSFL
jgi:hypothetical protein